MMPSKVHIDLERLPEFRLDRLTAEEILISSARKMREKKGCAQVVAYSKEEMREYLKSCPFCRGNEDNTPEETWSAREHAQDPASWRCHSFPNLFPCHTIEETKKSRVSSFFADYAHSGTGAHEVLVETASHNGWLTGLSDEQLSLAFSGAVERYFSLEKDPRFNQFYLFKNYGRDAGASLVHPHIQLVCTARTQKRIQTTFLRLTEYFIKHRECLLCKMIQEEKKAKRQVFITASFAVFVPFAAKVPFQVRVVPREHLHNPSFAHVLRDDAIRMEFASVLKQSLKRIKYVLQHNTEEPTELNGITDPPYNLMLFTAPYHANYPTGSFHWWVDILPRTTKMAGYEYGTGTIINPNYPEEDAELLKEALGNY